VNPDIRPVADEFLAVKRYLRSAHDDRRAVTLALPDESQRVQLRHEIDIDPDHGGAVCPEVVTEVFLRPERGVEDIHVEALRFQIGGNIQDPEWGIGFHDAKLGGIVAQEIAVCEEDVHSREFRV
jgi:hypothetical protein